MSSVNSPGSQPSDPPPHISVAEPRAACGKRVYLPVSGGARWKLSMNSKLARGAYEVRSRAVDFAGNVQRDARQPSASRGFALGTIR